MQKALFVGIAIVLVTACVLFVCRAKKPITAGVGSTQQSDPFSASPNPADLPLGRSDTPKVRSSAESVQFAQPDLMTDSNVERILAYSNPEVRRLFDDGFQRLADGKFLEARLCFAIITRSYSTDEAVPLADWAIGFTHYRGGGAANLMIASDHFTRYCDRYASNPELENFVRAAQIDIAVIQTELMRNATDNKSRIAAGETAVKALKAYLEKWPQGQHAPAARIALREIQDSVGGVK